MAEDILTARPGTYKQDVLQTFCHGERDMIEADNASTSIYQVLRMSRAAMTHLLIIRMSSIWPRMAEDILTTRPGTYQQDVLQSF